MSKREAGSRDATPKQLSLHIKLGAICDGGEYREGRRGVQSLLTWVVEASGLFAGYS